MRIFLTGGAGFVGTNLVQALLKEKHTVTIYDNFSSGAESFVPDSAGVTVIKGDVLDSDALTKAMKNHDLVFHLSANPDVRIGERNPLLEFEQGIRATFTVLEAMRQNGITQIAFSSSSVVYGEPQQLPTPESYGPLLPISLYGATKMSSEALLSAYHGTFGFTVWIFRFANVVGTPSTHGLLHDLFQKLDKNDKSLEVLGDGTQTKSYIHVRDLVDAMVYTINNTNERGIHVFNVGGDDTISVREIAEMVIKKRKSNAKIHYTGTSRGWKGDVTQMHLDCTKLHSTGWKQTMSSREAISAAIEEML